MKSIARLAALALLMIPLEARAEFIPDPEFETFESIDQWESETWVETVDVETPAVSCPQRTPPSTCRKRKAPRKKPIETCCRVEKREQPRPRRVSRGDKRFFVHAEAGPAVREWASAGRDQNGWVAGFGLGVTRVRSWALGLRVGRAIFEESGKGAYGDARIDVRETRAEAFLEAFPWQSNWSLEFAFGGDLSRSARVKEPSSDSEWQAVELEGQAWAIGADIGRTFFVGTSDVFLRPSLDASWGRLADHFPGNDDAAVYDQFAFKLRAGFVMD